MSTVGMLIQQTTEATGASTEAVRGVLSQGARHIPEGTKVNRESLAEAFEATRADLNGEPGGSDRTEKLDILSYLETELNSLGRLKQIVVFGAIGSNIGELREG